MSTARSLGFRCALPLCLTLLALLSGCGGGGGDDATTAGSSTGSSSSSSSTGTSASTITLSGTPPTSVVAGNRYVFQPAVSRTAGTATFSATGLPGWASFNSTTGEISGTPSSSNVGASGEITISASDGTATASLAPFQIDVTAAATTAATGSATLSWSAPTENVNGTPVTGLAGYRIHYGTAPGALTSVINVPGASTTEYEISNLSAGTYYFVVYAYNTMGVESPASNEASKTI